MNPPVRMKTSRQDQLESAFCGVLIGTAVGDALGLPAENLSPARIRRRWHGDWRMRLCCGRGMISDDTEHALMVAQALLAHPLDAAAFQRTLGWKLRWWFLALPGGVGLATARACLRLWVGFPAHRAGVTSAGSGPPMRSAILGACFADDPETRREFVLASSRLTHRGWQAETAALAVAESVALAVRSHGQPDSASVLEELRGLSIEPEWVGLMTAIQTALASGRSVAEFVQGLGLERGVTGYALHVVPLAIYGWLRHPGDFRAAMTSVLDAGGDTDTVGAILGALAGASGGVEAIPAEWRDAIWEWPRSVSFMERVGKRLAEQSVCPEPLGSVRMFWPGQLVRNMLFLGIILAHGFRRAAPPY